MRHDTIQMEKWDYNKKISHPDNLYTYQPVHLSSPSKKKSVFMMYMPNQIDLMHIYNKSSSFFL